MKPQISAYIIMRMHWQRIQRFVAVCEKLSAATIYAIGCEHAFYPICQINASLLDI